MDGTIQSRIAVHLWGDFRIVDGTGTPIEITNRKARACLALLATATAATISRERLAGMLWGDRSNEQARANLRQLLYELKPLTQSSPPVLGLNRHDVWFESLCDLDVDALARYPAGKLAASLPERGIQWLSDLDDIGAEFDEWLSAERVVAETSLRRSVQLRLEESLSRGDFAAVRALADAWARRDATDETIAQFGLRADAALGDRAGIERRMSHLEMALSNELDVEPSPATIALARSLAHTTAPPVSLAACPGNDRPAEPATREQGVRDKTPRRARILDGRLRVAVLVAAALLVVAGFAAWRAVAHTGLPASRTEAALLTTKAHALSRGRTQAGYAQAAVLARQAIIRDPEYAAGWAELAMASWMMVLPRDGNSSAALQVRADVMSYLERALKLEPALGRAHSVKGMILEGDAGRAALERAVVEAPDDAEAWFWLGNLRDESGFAQEALDAYRHAAQLDPLWERSVSANIIFSEEMHQSEAADDALDRFAGASSNRFIIESLRARLAQMRGDLVAAVRHGSAAMTIAPDDPWIQLVQISTLARAVGDTGTVQRLTSQHPNLRTMAAPLFDPGNAVARAEHEPGAWLDNPLYRPEEARQLLHGGRADLLLAAFAQQRAPLIDVARTHSSYDTALAAQLVVALRAAGRDTEASSLLAAIHAQLDLRTAHGYRYLTQDLDTAVALALDARDDQAVRALDKAVAGGWRGQFADWAVDPADEPAFEHLRGHPDFERIRGRLAAEVDRMRPEIAAILAVTPAPIVKIAAADDR